MDGERRWDGSVWREDAVWEGSEWEVLYFPQESRDLPHAHSDPRPCQGLWCLPGPGLGHLSSRESPALGPESQAASPPRKNAGRLAGGGLRGWVRSSGGSRFVAWVSLGAIWYAQALRAPGIGHRQSRVPSTAAPEKDRCQQSWYSGECAGSPAAIVWVKNQGVRPLAAREEGSAEGGPPGEPTWPSVARPGWDPLLPQAVLPPGPSRPPTFPAGEASSGARSTSCRWSPRWHGGSC